MPFSASALPSVDSPSAVVVVGLVGGFAAGRYAHRRDIAGAVFLAAGLVAGLGWGQRRGARTAAALEALYIGAMGGSHLLSRRIGAWPSVLAVTAATVAASEVATRAR